MAVLLVSDPYAVNVGIVSFTIQLDAQAPATNTTYVQTMGDGTKRLNWALPGSLAGSHTVAVSATNLFGTSDPATLTFLAGVPSAPGNLQLISE